MAAVLWRLCCASEVAYLEHGPDLARIQLGAYLDNSLTLGGRLVEDESHVVAHRLGTFANL